ncbi:MAG: hypothetical protein NTZ98_17345 [Acidobacteria bacterium]|jgi:hypothetical protein|nr:hypothetical protein [Acidobacteriota bacterium]
MIRTIINLDAEEKEWLERKAASEGVPMASQGSDPPYATAAGCFL